MSHKSVAVSIVNHGHDEQVKLLLCDLATHCSDVISVCQLTLNVPCGDLQEWIDGIEWPFQINLIHNRRPLGFSTNHNNALVNCLEGYFCILNPDVRIGEDPFPGLIHALQDPMVGCSYPMQTTRSLVPMDLIREVPTPVGLLFRHFGVKSKSAKKSNLWVNASFLLFRRDVYIGLQGFDERYFMYCEDVDICLRMIKSGYSLKLSTGAGVYHIASFASRRKLKHFYWHIQSLIRFWMSPVYSDFRNL